MSLINKYHFFNMAFLYKEFKHPQILVFSREEKVLEPNFLSYQGTHTAVYKHLCRSNCAQSRI